MVALAPQQMRFSSKPKTKYGWQPDGTFVNPGNTGSYQGGGADAGMWNFAGGGKSPYANALPSVPGGVGGSTEDILARMMGTAGTDFNVPMNEWLSEAGRIRDVNRGRRDQTLGYLNREQEMASKPTLTDEDVRTFGSRESDRITDESQSGLRDLASWMGASGVFGGGLPTGLAASMELRRMGQVIGARRDIKLEKARTDALDRAARFQRAQPIAGLMNEPEDTTFADALAGATGFRTNAWLGEKGLDAARIGAKAQEQSGLMQLFGGLAGGALGMFG